MPGGLTDKKKRELHRMIKECHPPKSTWTAYRVELRGSANLYEEAESRLNKLKNKKYAYSTDD